MAPLNAANSPAFSSSLAFPFFVPGHLIAALIYGSTRLPLPIYRYFMKITPLKHVNVCLFSSTTLRPNVSPKKSMEYLVKTSATYGRLNCVFPKPTELRPQWMNDYKNCLPTNLVVHVCFLCACCAHTYHYHGRFTPINSIVRWIGTNVLLFLNSV